MNKIDNEKRMKVFYFLVYVLIILIIVFATIKLLPLIIKLSNESTRNAAKEEIASMGIKGVFLVILLQVIQIVIAVIPGQPMEIISGMLYGTFGGMLICLIGIFIGTFIIFMIVRRLGMQFINIFFKEDSINKIKNSKIYRNPQKFEILMLFIFSIPIVPKDIFIYLGGISPVRTSRFLLIATIGRIPGLFLTVFMGNRLSEGNIMVVAMLTIIIILLGLLGYWIIPKIQSKLEESKNNI